MIVHLTPYERIVRPSRPVSRLPNYNSALFVRLCPRPPSTSKGPETFWKLPQYFKEWLSSSVYLLFFIYIVYVLMEPLQYPNLCYFAYNVISLSVLQQPRSHVYFQYKCDGTSDNTRYLKPNFWLHTWN